MTEFTPINALIGGALIGFSAVILLVVNGRIAGISGILSRIMVPAHNKEELPWEISFVIGLLLAPILYFFLTDTSANVAVSANWWVVGAAGLLVGFGAVIGGGCTSGHGVCGLTRFSKRSMAATASFMSTGAITVYFLKHVFGG
nr:YeeE/YedE family protein [Pseudovibrio stylochi]